MAALGSESEPLLTGTRKPTTLLTWVLYASGACAVMMVWQIEFVVATPLLVRCGMPTSFVSQIYTPAPIVLLFLTPIMSRWSDKILKNASALARRWGRVPFVAAIQLLLAISVLAIPFCTGLGRRLGDSGVQGQTQTISLAFLAIFLVFIDGTCAFAGGWARTVANDMGTTEANQLTGQNTVSAAQTLGGFLGSLIGAVSEQQLQSVFHTSLDGYKIMFFAGLVSLIPTTLLQCYYSLPDPLSFEAAVDEEEDEEAVESAAAGLSSFPTSFWIICLQQLMAWLGIYPVWLFLTAYFAADIYGGDGSAAKGTDEYVKYQDGVSFGSTALAAFSLMSFVVLFVVPWLMNKLGSTFIYAFFQILGSFAMVALYFVKEKWVALACVVAIAPLWSVNGALPFTLAANVLKEEDVGTGTNIVYFAGMSAQVVSGLVLGPVVSALQPGGFFSSAFLIGGSICLVAGLLSIWLFPRMASQAAANLDTENQKKQEKIVFKKPVLTHQSSSFNVKTKGLSVGYSSRSLGLVQYED